MQRIVATTLREIVKKTTEHIDRYQKQIKDDKSDEDKDNNLANFHTYFTHDIVTLGLAKYFKLEEDLAPKFAEFVSFEL